MSSDKKVAANRINAKKRTGPRSLRGKLQSKRNAWRHGLAAATSSEPAVSAEVERMAKSICGDKQADPDLYDLAVTIARCEIVLRMVRGARVERERMLTEPDRLKQLLPDLPIDEVRTPLGRYERRALSRRNRAIQRFQAITIIRRFLGRQKKHI
jgi:hypothetical protein